MNTSEFAKLCGVERRTLFHYDKIGILKPAHVRENGYREYTMEQLGMMDMIKIFQACGYTLTEIKNITIDSEESKYAHVQNALERIDERIDQLERMKAYLQSKRRLLEEYRRMPVGEYSVGEQKIRCERREIIADYHFFSFLRDGTYTFFQLAEDGRIFICRPAESGEHQKRGTAISFFLNISFGEPSIEAVILAQLERFGFDGDGEYYIESIPHFLLDDEHSAVLKVTVFRKSKAEI